MDLLDGEDLSSSRCVDRTCSPHRDLRALYATAQVLAAGSGQEETLLKILQRLIRDSRVVIPARSSQG